MRAGFVMVLMLFTNPLAWAGGGWDGHSDWPGLFFTSLNPPDQPEPVSVWFNRPEDAQTFLQHCSSGQAVFRYRSNQRYSCKADWYPQPPAMDGPGSGCALGVTVTGARSPADSQQLGMFSLQSTPTTRWQRRALTADERNALQAVIDAPKPRLALPRKKLQLQKTMVVSRAKSRYQTLIVPGNVVGDEEAYYYAQRHYVFVQHAGRIRYQGILPDRPRDYFDVDGDELPEILLDEQCDGWCISLWSIQKGMHRIADFGGH